MISVIIHLAIIFQEELGFCTDDHGIDVCFAADHLGVRSYGPLLLPKFIKYVLRIDFFKGDSVEVLFIAGGRRPGLCPGLLDFSLELGVFRLDLSLQFVVDTVKLDSVECGLTFFFILFSFRHLETTLYRFGVGATSLVVLALDSVSVAFIDF